MKKIFKKHKAKIKQIVSWKTVKKVWILLLTKSKKSFSDSKRLFNKHGKSLKNKTIEALQYIQYKAYRSYFLFPKLVKYEISHWLRKSGLKFFTTLYFIVLTSLTLLLRKLTNISIDIDDAVNFFVGSASMVGGSLAIVAAFALFTIQNAAENLPKSFYQVATDIKKYLLMFISNAAISMMLFIFSVIYSNTNIGTHAILIQSAVFGIGTSFYFIFILLYNLRNDIDPEKIVFKVTSELSSLIKEVTHKTREFAEILILHPKNRNATSVETLIANLYQSPANKQQFTYLNNHIEYLFDYHDKLLAEHQKSVAIEVLDDIQGIVITYLNSRKGNSMAFLEDNSVFVFTSDSKYILQPIIEKMIALSETYMKNEDTTGIIKVVNIFINWIVIAKEIEYVDTRSKENPILGQISGYFDQLVKKVINMNSLEGMFQSLRFYKTLALISIEKEYFHKLYSTLETMEEIGFQAIKTRQEVVISQVFEDYTIVLEKLISTDFLLHMTISNIMKHVNTLTLYTYVMTIKGTLNDNRIAQQDMAKPYKKLQQMIFWTVNKAQRATVIREKDGLQRTVLELAEQLRLSLRDLSGKFNNPNHFVVMSFGEIIESIGILLIQLSVDQSWSLQGNRLLSEARAYIHLPTWFLSETKKVNGDQSLDALVQAVTNIGITALEKDKNDIATESLKILTKMAMDILLQENGEDAMYIEPSIMEHACYVGILAFKKGNVALTEFLKTSIRSFEDKYKEKYFSDIPADIDIDTINPSPNKLRQDIIKLTDTRRNRVGIGLDDSKAKILLLVVTEDISNFITEIWEN